MKHFICSIFAGTFLLASALSAQTAPAGHWEGKLQVPDQEIVLTIDLDKNAKGEWIGAFGVPAQHISGLKIGNISIDGNNVKFNVPDAPGTPEFSGSLKPDGKLSLTLAANGSYLPIDMTRIGDAKVEIQVIKPDPAIDAKFEGDWEGTLTIPNGPTLRLVIHLHNQPDKTVRATLDSPDQGANGMALSEVVTKDAGIEVKLKMVGGGFKGTLSADGTELAGDWSQGGGSLPLKLKKTAAK
jgi:hypothetical protein